MGLIDAAETGTEIHSGRRRGEAVDHFRAGLEIRAGGGSEEEPTRRVILEEERRPESNTSFTIRAGGKTGAAGVRARSGDLPVRCARDPRRLGREDGVNSRPSCKRDARVMNRFSCYGLHEQLVQWETGMMKNRGAMSRDCKLSRYASQSPWTAVWGEPHLSDERAL